MKAIVGDACSKYCGEEHDNLHLKRIQEMASGNHNVVPGLPIADADGNRKRYLNTATGKIEDLRTQKMVFDTKSGKLMVVVSESKTIALDNQVFTEMDADGFFVASLIAIQPILNNHQNRTATQAVVGEFCASFRAVDRIG